MMTRSLRSARTPRSSWWRSLGIAAGLLLMSGQGYGQCTSGSTHDGPISPNAVAQTVSVPTGAPSYFSFPAVSGGTYTFTFCSGGGSATYDTYLTIADDATLTPQTWNDDFCGLSSQLNWTAPSSGTYRVYTSACCPCGNKGGTATMSYSCTSCATSACTGAPTPGNTTGPASACPSASFTLGLQNFTNGTGVTYDWQSSPDGLTWTSIIGANGPTYTATQTVGTYYQCTVTCSGQPTTSTPLLVSMNSFLNCYCTSSAANGGDEEIFNVTVGSLNNTSSCATTAPGPGSINSLYANYTTSVAPPNMTQLDAVSASVSVGTCGGNFTSRVAIFIDWNQNGLLTDAGEQVMFTSAVNGPHLATGSFVVPITAIPGNTLMRVVNTETTGSIFPCGASSWGETEDYFINVVATTPCVDPPTPGITNASPLSVCSGSTSFLSVTGFTNGSGQTFQWQSSPDNVTYTDVFGETNTFYNATVTAATYYRLQMICSGGAPVFSAPVQVTMNSFIDCYCTAIPLFSGYNNILNTTFGTLNNTSDCFTVAPGPGSILNRYSNFKTLPATNVTQLDVLPWSVDVQACTFGVLGTHYVAVYADWNQNGLLTDAGEQLYLSGGLFNPGVVGGSIAIPLTAVPGNTLLRVMDGYSFNPGMPPCGDPTYYYGETEDYLLNVIATVPCTDPATPGTATASAPSICPGTTVNLNRVGGTSGSSQTYQWESSPDDLTWSDVSGATASFYTATVSTPTYFRLRVTCTLGSNTPTWTNSVFVGMNNFLTCYCVSNALSTADEEIFNVSVGSINNTSNCATLAPGPGSIQSGYSNYTTSVPVANMPQTDVIPVSVQVGTCGGNWTNTTAIYIDWNQNGLLTDVGEQVFTSTPTNGPNTPTGSFIVPATATLGNTLMRVVTVETFGAFPPCGTYTWGETEDYLVNVTIPPTCQTPGASLGTVTASTAVVNWTCAGCTGNYIVEYGVAPFTPGTGATAGGPGSTVVSVPNGTNTYTITGLTSVTGYTAYVRMDCGLNGFSTNGAALNFTTSPGCGSNFYDNGGIGANYTNNANVVTTVCPTNPGELVVLSFTAFSTESSWDPLYVFNGPSTASPKFASANGAPFGNNVYGTGGWWGASIPGPFLSTDPSGCLTTAFTSDGSVTLAGWQGQFTCLPASACTFPTNVAAPTVAATSAIITWTCGGCAGPFIVEYGPIGFTPGTGASAGVGGTVATALGSPYTLTGLVSGTAYQIYVRQDCGGGLSYSYNNFAPVNITTSPGCGSHYYDSGGPGGNYGPNENRVFTFCPDNVGDIITLSVNSFNTESGWDPLYIFNGPTTASPKIASTNGAPFGNNVYGTGGYYGTTIPSLFLSTDASGCLTTAFTSDGSVQNPGWDISINCVSLNLSCESAVPVVCGDFKFGLNVGTNMNLPGSACNFNGAASTGGVSWWTYTATADQEVTVSTCATSSFNTRISVFAGADCNSLSCYAQNDDVTGCPGGSSELSFPVLNGQTYFIAVHGVGGANGTYNMGVSCSPSCSPANANDHCADALGLTGVLDNGTGTATVYDNSCAYSDGPTSCSSSLPVQGMWFSFNSGDRTNWRLYTETNDQNTGYTSTALSYAIYDGVCDGMGATSPVGCQASGEGATDINGLTINTDYRLLVYNQGGVGVEGTYSMLLTYRPNTDISVSQIEYPVDFVCTRNIVPVVTLTNNGAHTVTSATITYTIDGGAPVSYNWIGVLASGASTNVTLPASSVSTALHTLAVTSSLPNGVADEIPTNDGTSGTFDATGESVQVKIKTDNNGGQTSWEILDGLGFQVAAGGFGGVYGNNQSYATVHCLPTTFGDCFSLFIYDSFGDGMCCSNGQGFWELRNDAGALLLRDNGQFTNQSPSLTPLTAAYANGHEFCLPKGPSNIQASECDVYTNTLLSKVYCDAISGVGSYQFQFSNPDAGFRRRIAVPRNWVKFGEMVTNPLLPGTVYFAAVRIDQGTPGFADDNFGAGCEMSLDPAVGSCTQLIDDINLPTHSCGVTRQFAGSDKVWAQPVSGATQYRFRFQILAEGYVRNITRPNYICPLSWVTLPLQNGKTYDVLVEVMVSGVWSGFNCAACQLTIANPPSGGRVVSQENSQGFTLYPNPVRQGNVTIKISDLLEAEQHVMITVVDMQGRTVYTKQLENAGDQLNTTLEIGDDVAAGLYQVNVLVNSQLFTQQLSVE